MERIAAFVEGHTEARFIKAAYHNVAVQRPFPNGQDVPLLLIIDSIKDALETLGGSITRVLILLDREGRSLTSRHMAQSILSGITPHLAGRRLYIGVTDRHIENWILSDELFIQSKFSISTYTYSGDGSFGKSALRNIAGSSNIGPNETAKLLLACSPTRGAVISQSLADFQASIDFTWPWIVS